MNKKVNCIMLIDDNPDDNYFHERVIKKNGAAEVVIAKESAMKALDYLKEKSNHEQLHPDLIFLDINMPGMNGWEFLEEYKNLGKELQSKMVVVMLTTSDNPEDRVFAKTQSLLADFYSKPLTKEILDKILTKYYEEQSGK